MHDLIIIGGGPAAVSAGVYAGRKKIKTLIITESFGGQSLVSNSIENWIGIKKMTGFDFAKMLEKHLRLHESIEIKTSEKVIKVKEDSYFLEIFTDKNNVYQAKTLIIASGGRRRRLNISGENQFEGKGVSYCSTCDAPLFKNKIVAIIGGGNAGAEAVIDLIPYASKIYLINHGLELSADLLTIEEIKKSPKTSIINNAETQEIMGDPSLLGDANSKDGGFVAGLKYLDKNNNQVKELDVEGVFVEIGSVPNSEFLNGLVETNKAGEIIVDHKTGATSVPGIFAAGDITDEIYKQNNISAGDGIVAALSAYNYLIKINKQSPAQEQF